MESLLNSVCVKSKYDSLNTTVYFVDKLLNLIYTLAILELQKGAEWQGRRFAKEIPEAVPFLSRLGLKLESLGFPLIKVTVIGLSSVYVTRICCSLSMTIARIKLPCEDCRHIDFAFGFALLVFKNLKTPNGITWSGIQGLGSPLCICGQGANVASVERLC